MLSGLVHGSSTSAAASAWLSILIDAAVKGALVLALASAATSVMRRASASARHLVWLLAVAGLLLLPPLSATLPGWHVLPHWLTPSIAPQPGATTSSPDKVTEDPAPAVRPARTPIAAVPPRGAAAATDAGSALPQPGIARADRLTPVYAPVELPADTSAHTAAAPTAPQSVSPARPPESDPPSALGTTAVLDIGTWAFLVWTIGAVVVFSPTLAGLVSLMRLRATSTRITDPAFTRLVRELCRQMGVRRRVTLLRSRRRLMPMTWGLLRPAILLPDQAEEWSAGRRRVVLLHELGHVKRWDCVAQLLLQITCAAYWFNPLVWVAAWRMRTEQERACDDLVLGTGCKPSDYAEHLVQMISRLRVPRLAACHVISMARPSRLERRLLAILDPRRTRRMPARAGLLLAVVALAGVVLPLALLRAKALAEAPPAAPAEQAAASSEKETAPEASPPLDEPKSEAALRFQSVSMSVKSAWGAQPEHVEVKADGSCLYRIDERPARGDGQRWPPARLVFRIDAQKLRQLQKLLDKTDWLTAPGGEGPALHTDADEDTITLTRDGKTHTITCHGQRPEPYRSLVWFFRALMHQENLLYRLTRLPHRERLDACRNIQAEVESLEGKSGRMYPVFDVDYTCYLPTFTQIVRDPFGRGNEEVIAAIRFVTFMRAESEFKHIAALSHDRDMLVRQAVAEALADFGGQPAVPVLARMARSTHDAIWGLIRLGEIAVPSLVEMIQKTDTSADWLLSEHIVRGYLEHWNELPGPVDEGVVAAVRKALAAPPTDSTRTEYHEGFLELVESRPVPAGDLSCRIDYQTVYCPEPARFIHGWYTVADGAIADEGAAPAPEPGTKVFRLRFEVAVDGGRPTIRAGWEPMRGPVGEPPQPALAERLIDVPQETQLEVVYQYYRDRPKLANQSSPFRVTTQYRTLWEGRLVKDGQTLKRIVYAARVAGPDDPVAAFVPPAVPAATKAQPPKPIRQVTFRGMELTNAPKVSDPAVLHDLAIAWRNHAIRAAGGTPRDQSQTTVVFESPRGEATGQQFIVFQDPDRRVFYIQASFHQPRKRTEIEWYGPFEGDPREKLDLPGQRTGRNDSPEAGPTKQPPTGSAEAAGRLQFRILANNRDHASLVERARQLEGRELKDEKGALLAWWAPVAEGQEDSFARDKEIATRSKDEQGRGRLEVLVVKDNYDVDGRYLEEARVGTDPSGRPCIPFTLNAEGSGRLGALTSHNLPPEGQPQFARKLGIILNGLLYSAPAVRSTIFHRGEITGAFTLQEAQDLVNLLNGRRPPGLAEAASRLQLRILANSRDHASLIERARQLEGRGLKDAKGALLAWWVPVAQGQEDSFAHHEEIATRTKDQDGRRRLEVLVVKDNYDVDGRYLEEARVGTDYSGRPCIPFTLNAEGSGRLGALTSHNLPPEGQPQFSRKLGIILNGALYSAPAVRSTIFHRGEITGDFTLQEAQDVVDLLNGRTPPVTPGKAGEAQQPTPPGSSSETDSPEPAASPGELRRLISAQRDAQLEKERAKAALQDAQLEVAHAEHELRREEYVLKKIDIRYAKAALDVAEAELRDAKEANRRSPGAVTPTVLRRLELTCRQSQLKFERAEAQLAGDEKALKEIDVRYAKATLDVVEAELQQAKEANRAFRGAVTPMELRRLELTCRQAQLEVERAEAQLAGDEKALKEIDVRYAKATLDVAEAELEQAKEANRGFPGAVTPPELKRLELTVRQAQLKVERAEAQLAGDAKALKQIDVRYAKAALDVAEAQLVQAKEANHRFPGAVTPPELNRLELACRQWQLEVERAEAQLAGDAKALKEIDVRYAEAALDVAEAELQHAKEANRGHPGSVTASDLRRLELARRQAELEVERAEIKLRAAGSNP